MISLINPKFQKVINKNFCLEFCLIYSKISKKNATNIFLVDTQKVVLWFTDYPDTTLIDSYMPLANQLKTVIDMHVISWYKLSLIKQYIYMFF